MAKNIMVKYGNHTRHLAYWLENHGIGSRDKYDRGLWVSSDVLPQVERIMRQEAPNASCDKWGLWVAVNTHNNITYEQVVETLVPSYRDEKAAAEIVANRAARSARKEAEESGADWNTANEIGKVAGRAVMTEFYARF